jgi:hypothetical protein
MTRKTSPIKKEEEVRKNPDPHIDQDFDGFPGATSTREHITPKSDEEKRTAALTKKKTKKTYGE